MAFIRRQDVKDMTWPMRPVGDVRIYAAIQAALVSPCMSLFESFCENPHGNGLLQLISHHLEPVINGLLPPDQIPGLLRQRRLEGGWQASKPRKDKEHARAGARGQEPDCLFTGVMWVLILATFTFTVR